MSLPTASRQEFVSEFSSVSDKQSLTVTKSKINFSCVYDATNFLQRHSSNKFFPYINNSSCQFFLTIDENAIGFDGDSLETLLTKTILHY